MWSFLQASFVGLCTKESCRQYLLLLELSDLQTTTTIEACPGIGAVLKGHHVITIQDTKATSVEKSLRSLVSLVFAPVPDPKCTSRNASRSLSSHAEMTSTAARSIRIARLAQTSQLFLPRTTSIDCPHPHTSSMAFAGQTSSCVICSPWRKRTVSSPNVSSSNCPRMLIPAILLALM